ncbi:hypothetical protein ACFQ1S_19870, partial [Kibdelosporangium lantanae]
MSTTSLAYNTRTAGIAAVGDDCDVGQENRVSDQHHPEWPTADNDAHNATHPDTRSQPKTAAEENKTDTEGPRSNPETVTHPTPDPASDDPTPEPTASDPTDSEPTDSEATAGDTAKLVLGEATPGPEESADEPEPTT